MLGPYKNLAVWQKAMSFTTDVYRLTQGFPQEERLGLTSQIRRAVVSIPSNIAEGYGRSSDLEIVRFLHIALGSANEVETQLLIATNIGYISNDDADTYLTRIGELIAMLRSLIKSRQGC